MPYQIRRSRAARQDIRDFVRRLKQEASAPIAEAYFQELQGDINRLIANQPNMFNWFHETGSPYRAKLFKLAKATYWIIYIVDDENQVVELVRFWNTAREEGAHGL